LGAAYSDSTGLYKIWKIERAIWLEGLSAMQSHVMPEAIIIPPSAMPPQRMEVLLETAKRAKAFDDVEFSEQQFLNLGDTIIVTYHAAAKHQRFRRKYLARCMTTYLRIEGNLKIASHAHHKLSKR